MKQDDLDPADMGRRKDLSLFDKDQIVMARRLGRSISETARLVGCSRAAVVRIYQQWSEEGQIQNRRQGVGRPRLIDDKGQQKLWQLVETNERATVAQITEHFNMGDGVNVSQYTVHRTLLCMGLRSRSPVRMPILGPTNRKRLQWAREHQNWTVEQWKRVAWSSESCFILELGDDRAGVRRIPTDELTPWSSVDVEKACKGSVMFWATFCWESLGPIIHVDQIMNGGTYLNIVADHAHTFMTMAFPNGGGLFQQDDAPYHSARIVQEWFEEHGEEFELLHWPPDSSDLSPIEHLWDMLDQQLRSATEPPRTVEELKQQLETAWYQIPPDTYRGLVESMSLRVRAVLAAY